MPYTETTELVRAMRHGDQQAFNKLVMLYQEKIYNIALGYVKQEDEAKDLAQDIFITVYQKIDKLRDDNKFNGWIYQIAFNHCRNRYKKLSRRGFFRSQPVDDPNSGFTLTSESTPEKDLEKQRTNQMVRQAIIALPPAEKEIIMLRDIQEFSYDEVSAILDIPLGTVKSKLNRARISLKNRLKKLL